MKTQALGLIETLGLVAAIEAADAALKAAAVELINYEKVTGGLVTIAITGEVAAVQAAIAAGSAAAARLGQLVSQHVIPRPMADVDLLIKARDGGSSGNDNPPEDHDGSELCQPEVVDESPEEASYNEYLKSLSVHELRRLARTVEGIAIQGREISRANKELLIKEIMTARNSKQ